MCHIFFAKTSALSHTRTSACMHWWSYLVAVPSKAECPLHYNTRALCRLGKPCPATSRMSHHRWGPGSGASPPAQIRRCRRLTGNHPVLCATRKTRYGLCHLLRPHGLVTSFVEPQEWTVGLERGCSDELNVWPVNSRYHCMLASARWRQSEQYGQNSRVCYILMYTTEWPSNDPEQLFSIIPITSTVGDKTQVVAAQW